MFIGSSHSHSSKNQFALIRLKIGSIGEVLTAQGTLYTDGFEK